MATVDGFDPAAGIQQGDSATLNTITANSLQTSALQFTPTTTGNIIVASNTNGAFTWSTKYSAKVKEAQPGTSTISALVQTSGDCIVLYAGTYTDTVALSSGVNIESFETPTITGAITCAGSNVINSIVAQSPITINGSTTLNNCNCDNITITAGTNTISNCSMNTLVCSGGITRLTDCVFKTGTTAITMSSTAELWLNNVIIPPNVYTTEITMGASNILNAFKLQADSDKLTLAGTFNVNYIDRVNQAGSHVISGTYFGLQGSAATSAHMFGQGTIKLNNFKCFREPTVGVFVDITSTMLPSSNTNNTLFPQLVAPERVYFGDLNKFSGFNLDIVTAAVGGTYTWEYWNGSAWTALTVMVSNSLYPYESYTVNLGTVVQRQNVRFNNQILLGTAWQATTVNGVSKFWVRYNETSNATTSAVVKNLRLNGNQLRVNPNSVLEMFGLGRSRQLAPFNALLMKTPPGGSTQNQNIFVAPTIGFTRTDNSMAVGDTLTGTLYLQATTDTSTPCFLIITYFTNGTSTNVMNFTLTYAITSDGEPLYLASGSAVNPPRFFTTNFTLTPTITLGTSRQNTAQIAFDLSQAAPKNLTGKVSDVISLLITRNADTNANRLIILDMNLSYLACFAGFSEN